MGTSSEPEAGVCAPSAVVPIQATIRATTVCAFIEYLKELRRFIDALRAWCPNPRCGFTRKREHQLIQALHERRGIVELTALGQRRLIEQDVTPVREPAVFRFVFQPIHDR